MPYVSFGIIPNGREDRNIRAGDGVIEAHIRTHAGHRLFLQLQKRAGPPCRIVEHVHGATETIQPTLSCDGAG